MGAACAAPPAPEKFGKVKVFYLDGLMSRGLVMAAVCEGGGVDYEYAPVDAHDFIADKTGKSIWGFMPEMELPDGTRIGEVCAICQILAKEYPSLAGATPADEGISNMIGSRMNNYYTGLNDSASGLPAVPMNLTRGMWEDPKMKGALKEAYDASQEKNKPIMAQFEKLCKSDGKFTSTGTTWGEYFVWAFLEQYRFANLAIVTPMPPNLAKFMARMDELPACKAAVNGTSKFGKMGRHVVDHAQWGPF